MVAKSATKNVKRKGAAGAKPAAAATRKPAKSAAAPPRVERAVGKTKAAKPVPATNNHRAKKSAEVFYIVVDRDELRIATTKPSTPGRVESASTFDEAKDRAIDALIALIDGLEESLWAIKQSSDYQDYQARVAGR